MHGDHYLSLLILTALAATVPLLATRFRRVRVPIVVVEILAGIAIGTSGADLIAPSEVLVFLQDLGFAYLMFLSGLEVDFRALRRTEPSSTKGAPPRLRAVPLALLCFCATFSLAYLVSLGLSLAGFATSPLLMSLILSTSSLGIVLPVLKERGIVGQSFGQYFLVAALVADFATLLLLTFVLAAGNQGSLNLFFVFGTIVASVVLVRLGMAFASNRLVRQLVDDVSHATSQVKVRGSFALMVACVVLAEAIGLEIILGAFLAGTFVSLMAGPEHSLLREKLDAIGFGFFIPLFFIMVGVNFDLSVLAASKQGFFLFPVLLIAAYLVKLVPSLMYSSAFGVKRAIAGGFLLSSRLSLIIAASAIALKLGKITPEVNAAVVLVAITTSSVSPLIFNALYGRSNSRERSGIIIAGTDHVARLLADRLVRAGESVTIIGRDDRRLVELGHHGLNVVRGLPQEVDTLRKAGADTAAALIVTTAKTETRVELCTRALDDFNLPLVVACANSVETCARLGALGVKVVQPALASVVALEGVLRFPNAFETLLEREDGVEMGEAILNNPSLHGVSLRNVRLPGNAVIVGIRRNSSVVVPHSDTKLERGDRLALVGTADALAESRTAVEH